MSGYARELFIVTDVFTIRGRGIVLLPGIVPQGEEKFRIGDGLELRRPDSTNLRTRIAGLEQFTCTHRYDVPVLLPGDIGTADVPIGTAVWSIE